MVCRGRPIEFAHGNNRDGFGDGGCDNAGAGSYVGAEDVCAVESDGKLVTAPGDRELAVDGCEDNLDLSSEPNQNRDGNEGNECQDQGVLDEGLALLVSFLAGGDSFRIHPSIPFVFILSFAGWPMKSHEAGTRHHSR